MMARAFKCDDCSEMYVGSVENGLEVSGLGLTMPEYIELCHGCAVKRLDGIVDFNESDAE